MEPFAGGNQGGAGRPGNATSSGGGTRSDPRPGLMR